MQFGIQRMGCGAAQQIDFILVGGCDQQIRIPDTCLEQNLHGSTVSLDTHYIVTFHTGTQQMIFQIDQGNVMTFRRQLPGQHRADFAVACNNNIHKESSSYRKMRILAQITMYYIKSVL